MVMFTGPADRNSPPEASQIHQNSAKLSSILQDLQLPCWFFHESREKCAIWETEIPTASVAELVYNADVYVISSRLELLLLIREH